MHIPQHQHLHQHSQQQSQTSLQNQPQQQILLQSQHQVINSSQPQQNHSNTGVVNHHISNNNVMGQQDTSNRSSLNVSNLQPYLHQISQHTNLSPQSVSQQHQQQLRSISSNQQIISSSPVKTFFIISIF